MPHRIGQDGHRPQRIKQIRLHACRRQGQGRFLGEHIAFDSAVKGDHHALVRNALRLQIMGQAHGGPADIIYVHPVGAHAQHAPQTARAKGQFRIEPIFDFLFVAGNGLQLLHRFRIVGKAFQPAFIFFPIAHCASLLLFFIDFIIRYFPFVGKRMRDASRRIQA